MRIFLLRHLQSRRTFELSERVCFDTASTLLKQKELTVYEFCFPNLS